MRFPKWRWNRAQTRLRCFCAEKRKATHIPVALFELALDLHSLYVLSLPTLGSFNYAELNGLAFLQ